MTREEAKEWLPLLQAYADGAEIEGKCDFKDIEIGRMISTGEFYLEGDKPSYYRIKPQDHSKQGENHIPRTEYGL